MAYLSGEAAAWHSVKTPLEEENLILEFDISGKPLNRLTTDIIFLYAKVIDKNGMVVPDYSGTIHFAVNGSAELIGENPLKAEAGIASILLKSKSGNKTITVTAQAQTSGGNIISTQKSIN